jgi:hypothetical protein
MSVSMLLTEANEMRASMVVVLVCVCGRHVRQRGRADARSADGKPDLSGVWQTMNAAAWNVEDHSASMGVPAGQGVVEGGAIPYLPAALAKRNDNFTKRATADPEAKCYLLGVPRIMYSGFPFQIVQTRDQIAMLFEWAHATRNVYTNGAASAGPHRLVDGRLRPVEGDTLVVDIVHSTSTRGSTARATITARRCTSWAYTPIDKDHIATRPPRRRRA